MLDAERLKILTESAKYDVSCSSSGSNRKNSSCGLGNAHQAGICHSFTPDGRCISLLKILVSNRCVYDCKYCVNRRSNDVPRALATPDEICDTIINFYKRNLIEGVLLSSAVETSPDNTMELLTDIVIRLRKLYFFHGYIHVKGIPGADRSLINRAASYADRMSFNIELPSEKSLRLLAPQKSRKSILLPMKQTAAEYIAAREDRLSRFLPAGQTTQMIIGASQESDGQIIRLTEGLYSSMKLKRVYFSSYVPVNRASSLLPKSYQGLLREHRLYQADWLLRFYGFSADELIKENANFDLTVDPKCNWALNNMQFFPVEINTAPPEVLLRVPGIGFKSASKIVQARKYGKIDFTSLTKMRVVLKRAVHFITVNGKFYGSPRYSSVKKLLTAYDGAAYEQMTIFSTPQISLSVLGGQL